MTLQFEEFYAWSKRELNLQLDGYKQKQLQRRITTIMKKSGSDNLTMYARTIKQDPEVKKAFLDYITINVTEFYRNDKLFAEFEQILVNDIAPKFPSLKIWSAACSTGAEAYSVAMILKKQKLENRSTIIGTDIDQTILQKAREGIYRDGEIKNIHPTDLKQYFVEKEGQYHLTDAVKKMVTFRQHDLILDAYPKDCQVIICRNVMIYFNDEVKENIFKKVSEALVPGGIFFIGATETIYNPSQYGLRKIGSFLYEKVGIEEG
ncbi:CheR family methyltransferase [Jeotgalibaca caeni]|uniref:CheR family methyltransferase n=1 Tax=Jeotgalibaca caeni TaxID=3028623 RepID=UPI00237EB35C|nr:protein-glutamate O-methyltransferase CheR [Jeotgalibaca caeni]MDE1548304.1 protein-glutamate O-methyltransferase CheR [Jeotgalibaca caeni]